MTNPTLTDPPEWFIAACRQLWAEIEFETIPFHNPRCDIPFHPETWGGGTFHRAFDNQPGSERARQILLETSHLADWEKKQIIESLEARGITYCSGTASAGPSEAS